MIYANNLFVSFYYLLMQKKDMKKSLPFLAAITIKPPEGFLDGTGVGNYDTFDLESAGTGAVGTLKAFAGFTIGITAMILMIAFILNTVKLVADTDFASRREESRKQIMVNLFAIALLGAINLLILMSFGLLR